jgi:NADH-quinone oxidoreductase subunit N
MDATALLDSTAALLPHLTVLLTGLIILSLDLFLTPRSRYLNEVVGILGLGLALLFTLQQSAAPRPAFLGMAVADGLSAFFNAAFLLIALLTILLSASTVRHAEVGVGEYYALVLFATTGFMFVGAAADLVMLFLAIETLSIATYILAGLQRQEPRSQEAAFKYFILGAFSSAFFPVWHCDDLWGAGPYQPADARQSARGGGDIAFDTPGHGPADGRPGVQGGCGALPYVGAGCL